VRWSSFFRRVWKRRRCYRWWTVSPCKRLYLFLWVLIVMLMDPGLNATTTVQSVQAGVTSCVQVKLKGKREKGSSGSFLRLLVFGWIGFVGSNAIWAGSLLLG